MIEERTPVPVLLLDAGHGVYGFPPEPVVDPDGKYHLSIECLGAPDEDSTEEQAARWMVLAKRLVESPHNWLDDSELEEPWTTLVRISGDWHGLLSSFLYLAAALMPSLDPSGYTPGGDDDYYDYYPSGMRLLREMAIDLQELVKDDNEAVVAYASHYADPGPVGVYMAVAADLVRREARRWEPNYLSCGNVGHDYFFESEGVDVYVRQLCEHYGMPNTPHGWRDLGREIGLSYQAYVAWITPTAEQVAYYERNDQKWEPKYTVSNAWAAGSPQGA